MARDLSCPSGLLAYKTKADALKAEGDDTPVDRCHRCRWWHVAKKARGRRRTGKGRR